MLFSIIIPIYNVEKYVRKTLKSVSNQKLKNFEVLLIDDGSVDDSSRICSEFINDNENWFYYKKKNGGLSDARNYGLKKAVGEYIIFLDGDDQIVPETTEYFTEVIKKEKFDIICGLAEKIEKNKSEIFNVKLDDGEYNGLDYFISEMQAKTLFMAVWLRIYSRRYLIENDFFFKVNRLHEDEEFTPRVLIEANKIYVTHFCFYKYLTRDESITQKKDKHKNGLDIIQTMKELDKYFDENVTSQEAKKLMDDYIVSLCLIGFTLLNQAYSKNQFWDKTFLKKKAKSKKNKVKLSIFNFNPQLYTKLYKILVY